MSAGMKEALDVAAVVAVRAAVMRVRAHWR